MRRVLNVLDSLRIQVLNPFMAMVLVGAVGVGIAGQVGAQITFPDPNLEAAIRDALGKPDGPITEEDLAGLTELVARDRGIRDLTGMEYCVNLERLNLGDHESAGNQISDLSPLAALLLPEVEDLWLRFVQGRPVSAVTLDFLEWVVRRLEQLGKTALLLVWDNATWHKSQLVTTWINTHNRLVKTTGQGVRIVRCFLPVKSPWLNPIEPKWLHGKKAISEPGRVLSAEEIQQRVHAYYGSERFDPLVQPKPKKVA